MHLQAQKTIETAEEILGLRACMNDLMGVLALPAIWAGRDQEDMLSTLLDGIRRLLELAVVYATITTADSRQIEMIRIADTDVTERNSRRLRKTLNEWLRLEPQLRPPTVTVLGEKSELGVAAFNFGMDERLGVFVAGCTRSGFPNKSDRLLLGVAANEALAGLREAQLLRKQCRVAENLDLKAPRKGEPLGATSRHSKREWKSNKTVEEASGFSGLRQLEGSLALAPEKAIGRRTDDLQSRYDRLTPREREVLPFVVAGRLSKQTAADLGVSEITIRVHRGQIMRKMQAGSLAALIRMADALGVRQLSVC